jgi:hypothetical protein
VQSINGAAQYYYRSKDSEVKLRLVSNEGRILLLTSAIFFGAANFTFDVNVNCHIFLPILVLILLMIIHFGLGNLSVARRII